MCINYPVIYVMPHGRDKQAPHCFVIDTGKMRGEKRGLAKSNVFYYFTHWATNDSLVMYVQSEALNYSSLCTQIATS